MTKEKIDYKKKNKLNTDEEILIQIRKREAANAALKKMLEELEKKRKK